MRIPANIGSRIKEVYQEKNLKVVDLLPKLRMSRSTFDRLVSGDRSTNFSELREIALALDIKLERLIGEDTRELENELETLLKSGNLPKRAYNLALEWYSKAIGATERMKANWSLGTSLIAINKKDDSKSYFVKALEYAKMTGNFEWAKDSANRIVLYYYHKNDFNNLWTTVREFEEYFKGDPDFLGKYYLYIGLCAHGNAEFGRALEYFENAISKFDEIGDEIQKGRTLFNIADVFFCQKRYNDCLIKITESAKYLGLDSSDMQVRLAKDTARIHLILGNKELALQFAKTGLSIIEEKELVQPEIQAKLLLIKSKLLNDDTFAVKVFSITNNKTICATAAKFLTNFYYKGGDFEKSSSYALKLISCLDEGTVQNVEEL